MIRQRPLGNEEQSLQGFASTCGGHRRPFCPLGHISVLVVLSSFLSYPDFMAVVMRMFNK